jgi:hypothetical protein
MSTTSEDKPLSIAEQVIAKTAELVAQATDADRSFVERLKKSGPAGTVETVQPVHCALILDDNKHNRRFSNSQFNMIMGILMRGEWKRTHQGMAFYENGSLMDAQHRCGASVLTGIPLSPIMVSGGYNKDDNDAIDAGAKRTAADAAHLAGVDDAKLKCSIVEAWMRYDHFVRYGTSATFTNHQIKVKAIEYDDALSRGISVADSVIKTHGLTPMTKKEIAARAFEMERGGWSPVFIQTLLALVNSGTADYEGAPTVYLSEAYSKDRDEKSRFKLSSLQRQAMWHKVAGLYSHKQKVAKNAVQWKMGNPIPAMSPPSDIAVQAEAAE